jgi:hypothetical protein
MDEDQSGRAHVPPSSTSALLADRRRLAAAVLLIRQLFDLALGHR